MRSLSVLLLLLASLALNGAHASNLRASGQSQEANYFQVLFDVTASVEPGYRTGFGYAVFVQFEGKRLLFDTGADAATLAHNLEQAGIDPATLDAVAVSHNHFDHMGGLAYIRGARPDLTVFVPPGQEFDGGKTAAVTDSMALGENLYLLRTHTDTPTVGISDELSVLIRTAQGPYLVTACSHTSVKTIVDKASETAGDDVYYYTGGARLKSRGAGDAKAVAEELKARSVTHVAPGHCSVDHAVERVFKEAFPTGYIASRLGARVPLLAPGS